MTTTTHTVREFDTKATAAELRKALRAAFPGVKFSVRMSRGTGYGWFSVSYTDGPISEPVRALCSQFESESFDGMDDSYHYVPPTLYANPDGTFYEPRYTCRGVNVSREISDEATAWAATVAIRGSWWWPIGCEFDHWRAPEHYAARALLAGIDLRDGYPTDPRGAFVERWERTR